MKWIYDGLDLSDLLTVMSAPRDIGNDRSITTDSSPILGVNVRDIKTAGKTISINFYLKDRTNEYAINQLKHKLAGLFNKKEPVKNVFDDEPDKYYLGFVVGLPDLDDPISWLNIVTVKLFVPDGVAHSAAYRKFETVNKIDGKYVIDVENDGNVDALPIIKIKNNDENGYVGLVNTSGVFEAGTRDEEDGKIVQKSKQLINYEEKDLASALADAKKNVSISNEWGTESQSASVGAFNGLFGRNHLGMQLGGSHSSAPWITSSLTWDIPADPNGEIGSLYDYIWWRQVFWAGDFSQGGFIKVTVSDENDQFLYGLETMKRGTGSNSRFNVLVRDVGEEYSYKLIYGWNFKPTSDDMENPFNSGRGFSDIIRSDDKLSVFWFGSREEITAPGIKGKKSKKIHVTFGKPYNQNMITHMYLDSIKYTKNNMSIWEDIPNKFAMGTTVTVDSEINSLKVDEIQKLELRVIGSDFLTIPPGKSQVQILQSKWNEIQPGVSVAFEERWI